MLKLTPRTTVAAVLAIFLFLLGIQHFIFSVGAQDENSDLDLLRSVQEKVPLLPWIERTDFDIHLRYHKPGKIHPDVMVIDVNERSIQEIGQFPFPRKVYAKLIENLQKYGAKVVAFDITFPEKERNHALEELQKLREEMVRSGAGANAISVLDERIKAQDGDDQFAKALKKSEMPVVMGFAFSAPEAVLSGAKDISPEQKEIFQNYSIFRNQVNDNAFVHSMSGLIPAIPHIELLRGFGPKTSLASFSAQPDADSVIRKVPAVMGYGGFAVTTLAVRAVASYLGVEPSVVGGKGLSIQDKDQKNILSVPLFHDGSYLVRYYGGARVFPFIEFSDVISDNPEKQKEMAHLLKGKLLFVGVTAVGLKDIRANPFSENYPGVEVHATFASNMLTRSYLEMDQRYFFYGYLFILFFGFAVGYFVFGMHPLLGFPFTLALVILFQFLVQDLFFDEGVVVPSLLPSFAALGVFFTGVLYRYFKEEKEKRMVRTAFSRYVSGPVVEEILKDQTKLKLGGQKKVLTVMFCDLVGFTKLSESMDPTKLTNLLNEYFTRMTRIILNRQGTLDKYMGDAVMCFWGAPIDIPNHAELACKAAIEMNRELDYINREWSEKYNVQIGMRIGIHTGEMNVGNMGSEQVFSYTVMGDNVNLGSRLEGVNNIYGTSLLCSKETMKAAGSAFRFRKLDAVRVKGKEEAVEIFELEGLSAEPDNQEKLDWNKKFEAVLQAYQAGQWDRAEELLYECIGGRPEDMPSKVFLERIQEFKKDPPKNWDGVWRLNAK